MSLTQLPQAIRRNPWPYALVVWFVLFISGMASWAVVAVRQNQDLVRPDYYEAEIRHQGQIDRVQRTAAIRHEVSLTLNEARGGIELRLPPTHLAAHADSTAPRPLAGRVEFYRPSDARLDFTVPVAPGTDGVQHLDTRNLRGGLWKVRVHWTSGTDEFYYDQSFVL
jgi:nitrogen fixation protein FixH